MKLKKKICSAIVASALLLSMYAIPASASAAQSFTESLPAVAEFDPNNPDFTFEVTRKDLEYCLELFTTIDPLDYADESYAVIQAEANKIQKLLEKEDLTQEEMQDAVEAFFLSLYNALFSRDYIAAEMGRLDEWYQEKIDESIYSEDSIAALKGAMQHVHTLLADPNSSVEELNAAYQAIDQAFLDLSYKTVNSAKGLLGTSIAYLEANSKELFKEENLEVFALILDEVKAVYKDEKATEEELSDALISLVIGAKGCKISNRGISDLATEIHKYVKDTVNLSKCPRELVTKYRDALDSFKQAMADKDGTVDGITAALNKLGISVNALFTYKFEEEKPEPPKPPVVKPDKKPNNQSSGSKNPATGDTANTALPLAVLGLSAVAIAIGKKKDK